MVTRKKLPAETAAVPNLPPPPKLPAYVPLPQVPTVFGLSKSATYRAVAQGQIVMRKLGRSSLVESRSVLEFLANLPAAQVRTAV